MVVDSGVRNMMKMTDISFLKVNQTVLTSKFKDQKLTFHSASEVIRHAGAI